MIVSCKLAFDSNGMRVEDEVCHLSSLFLSTANHVSSMTSNHFDKKLQIGMEHLSNDTKGLQKRGFFVYLCELSCTTRDDLTEIKQKVVESIIEYLTALTTRPDGDVIAFAYHIADSYCSSLMEICDFRVSNSSIKEVRDVTLKVQREAKKYDYINYWFIHQLVNNNKTEEVEKIIKISGQKELFDLNRKIKSQKEKITLELRKSKTGVTILLKLDQGGYLCKLQDKAADQLKKMVIDKLPVEVFANVDFLLGGRIELKEFEFK